MLMNLNATCENWTLLIRRIVEKKDIGAFYCDKSNNSFTGLEFSDSWGDHVMEHYTDKSIWLYLSCNNPRTLGDLVIAAIHDDLPDELYFYVPLDMAIYAELVAEGLLLIDQGDQKMSTKLKATDEGLLIIDQGDQKMSTKLKATATALATQNKGAAVLAAQLVVGKAANTLVIKTLKPKLPMAMRGFLTQDSFVSRLVAANVAAIAVEQFMPENAKAIAVSRAMLQDAYIALTAQFNIEDLMSEMLGQLKGKKVDTIIDNLD